MSRYRKTDIKKTVGSFLYEQLPNKNDGIQRILIKSLFLLCVLGIVFATAHYGITTAEENNQKSIIRSDISLYNSVTPKEAHRLFTDLNGDYAMWLSSPTGFVSGPVFRSDDNGFYMSHNSKKESSIYGSLCMDRRNTVSDKNIVIYGRSDEDGILFGNLNYLRLASFYNKNRTLELNKFGNVTKYDIYAVFVLNSKKEQDMGKIYDIYRNWFSGDGDFAAWVTDAKKRSIINTGISVDADDNILTLVTNCDDFEDARLVVMARSRDEEDDSAAPTLYAKANPKPKYPKIWYTVRNAEYPFEEN